MQPIASAPAADDAGFERRRAEYERELASGRDRFFHPLAESCPWCGAGAVRPRIELVDTRQCKPGSFRMWECRSCGHLFQNPRLTEIGLAYYYRDSYDGIGRDHYASVARFRATAYRTLVRLLGDGPPPARWLDVGARHGHLCAVARELLPGTRFWALDPSPVLRDGARLGWVDVASHAPLTEFARQHAGEFDVVSMVHYLERTPCPAAEVDAARTVLRDGGVALIELVNPASRFAALHGRFWYGWMAPQNLHLIPHRNLCRMLAERGFEVVRLQLGAANKPFDNVAAVLTALNRALPAAASWPWLGRPVRPAQRLLRRMVLAVASPVVALAFGLDLLLHVMTSGGRGGNAYRVVAAARPRSTPPS
ncbi:class I SAM-dependent methyltransferase [Actinokineospora sp. NPDC004072]